MLDPGGVCLQHSSAAFSQTSSPSSITVIESGFRKDEGTLTRIDLPPGQRHSETNIPAAFLICIGNTSAPLTLNTLVWVSRRAQHAWGGMTDTACSLRPSEKGAMTRLWPPRSTQVNNLSSCPMCVVFFWAHFFFCPQLITVD